MFYDPKTVSSICTILGMFFSVRPGRDIRRVKTPGKSVLSSSPGEGGFCSSETKHDRRTAPRPKLFVSVRRLW
jgi:hypothetical protein